MAECFLIQECEGKFEEIEVIGYIELSSAACTTDYQLQLSLRIPKSIKKNSLNRCNHDIKFLNRFFTPTVFKITIGRLR